MFVICAGMYRSGSTWQYQVASDLLGRGYGQVQKLGFMDGPTFSAFLAQRPPQDVFYILKTHEADPAFDSVLAEPSTCCLYSFRDLRDVAYSMAHKIGGDFRTATDVWQIADRAIVNHSYWSNVPGAVIQKYESWIADERPAIRAIAARLGVTVSPDDVNAIRNWYSLDRNKERTARLTETLQAEGVDLAKPENVLRNDSESLLHWNHIREGRIGSWRMQGTPEEIRDLEDRCGTWLIENGYEVEFTPHEPRRENPPEWDRLNEHEKTVFRRLAVRSVQVPVTASPPA